LPKFHEDIEGCIEHEVNDENGKKKASKVPALLGQNYYLKIQKLVGLKV
jgi:hypothetical protein